MNTKIYIFIFIIIIITCYSYKEHLTSDIVYEKSELDNNVYLVRDAPNKNIASDLLAILTFKLKNHF